MSLGVLIGRYYVSHELMLLIGGFRPVCAHATTLRTRISYHLSFLSHECSRKANRIFCFQFLGDVSTETFLWPVNPALAEAIKHE